VWVRVVLWALTLATAIAAAIGVYVFVIFLKMPPMDKRFFDHGAIDLRGIVRSAFTNLRAGAIRAMVGGINYQGSQFNSTKRNPQD